MKKKELTDSAPAPGAEEQAVIDYLKTVKFKKRIGGVDEADVWKKIGEINALYEKLLVAQKAGYEAALAALRGGSDAVDTSCDSRDEDTAGGAEGDDKDEDTAGGAEGDGKA